MEITQEQYERIADCFPVQRGNVKISNLEALNAILFIVENGCKWRALPEHFGHWHTIYTRMSRWARSGVLERVFDRLRQERIVNVNLEAASIDSTSIRVHPDGTGPLKKTVRKPLADRGAV